MNNSWFSHDSNARNSKKMIRLRQKYGAEGYGVYWMLIERLREDESYTSETDYEMLAFDLRVGEDLIRSVVEDFGLFDLSEDGRSFTSHGLEERMELREKKSVAGRKGASSRWDDKNGIRMAQNGKTMADEMAKDDSANGFKGKERKEKERKGNSFSSFSSSPDVAPESEEEQQQFFLEQMFFKNWNEPEKELQKFLAWNNTGGRNWASLSWVQKKAAFDQWKQQPSCPPRFPADFLKMWEAVYQTMLLNGAPDFVLHAALSDDLRAVISQGALHLYADGLLCDYIEREDKIGLFSPLIVPYMTDHGAKKLIYHKLDHEAK